MATKLTQKEADMLISMLKESVEKDIEFPTSKGRVEFDAVDSVDKKEKFIVNISRKGINSQAVSYQGRHPRTGEILLRLDINPNTFHRNPSSGEKVVGNHIHFYTEEFGIKEAIPFDLEGKNFYDLCMEFFKEFNLVDAPRVRYIEPLF